MVGGAGPGGRARPAAGHAARRAPVTGASRRPRARARALGACVWVQGVVPRGDVTQEPMGDLMALLASLTDDTGRLAVAGALRRTPSAPHAAPGRRARPVAPARPVRPIRCT